jgi:TonB-dependent receptor
MKQFRPLIGVAVCVALGTPLAASADSASAAPILFTVAQSAAATTATAGTISGRVVDDGRGNALPGALVKIVGSDREARTNREGRFAIAGLPAGNYSVEIDYLGYETQIVEVGVSAAAGGFVQVRLVDSRAAQLENIVVYGFRDQQTRELNQQRASDNIINVISSDSIGRFPDGNVAEALSRAPGLAIERDQGEGRYVSVRGTSSDFNAVAVNGIVLPAPDPGTRAVDLDTIPTDIVSSLEITKALTPDMDADSIGGHINIVTQGALDADGPVRRGSAGFGRNQLGGGNNQRYALTLGDKFGADRFGALLSASYSETVRETDNFENVFDSFDDGIFAVETEFKDYEVTRERYAVNGRLDFAPSDRSRLFVSGLYSRFSDDEFRHAMLLEYDDYAAGSNPRTGTFTDVAVTKELRNRKVQNTITSFSVGGDFSFESFDVDFSASTTEGKQEYPLRNYFTYELGFEPDIGYDWSSPNNPVWITPDGAQNRLNFAPEDYEFSLYQVRDAVGKDRDISLASNIRFPIDWARASGEAQFGVKYRGKRKESDEDRKETENNVLNLSLADVTRAEISDNFGIQLGDRYRTDLFQTFGPDYESDPDFVSIPRRAFTADYRADEDILAAYGMTTLDWGATRVVLGARVEHTEIQSDAFRFDRETDLVTPTAAKSSYTKFFPSLHLRREIGDDAIIRAAYTTAINRPRISQLVPAIEERDRGPGSREVALGNPDLDPTFAHNLDLMFDYYLRPLGVVSVGLYYKQLSDVIFSTTGLREFEGEDGWDVTQPENGDRGRVFGVELNWQQVFSMLPAPMDGLGVFANYTYADSEADLPRGFGEVRLPGQSDHTYNAGIFYEIGGFSTRLAYNWRSEYIDAISLAGREFDIYWDEREQLDFTVSYQATPGFQIYGEAANLTDSRQNRFSGETSRVYEREGFGEFFQVGLRMSFE